jgi:chemotaxis protein methyltransferase CheR
VAEPSDELEELEVRLFLEAIYARYGYDLRSYAAASMRRRVTAALHKTGLPHLGELQHRVLTDPALFATVLDDLTVRVTELFRDPTFFAAFRARVVPVLRTYPLLKIWHSGCASGEEAYSAAIVLDEEGVYDRAQLYATDVSQRALDQAQRGIYDAAHLKTVSENYVNAGGQKSLSTYITGAYERFAMNDSLRKNMLFFQHNLVSDHAFGEMHVIFCRNVLFYFDDSLRDRVIEKFTQSLCPGGFLCLGSSERLPRRPADEKLVPFVEEARIYRYEP